MAKKLIDKQALNYNTAYDMANKALLVGLNETEVKFVESPTLDIKKQMMMKLFSPSLLKSGQKLNWVNTKASDSKKTKLL